MEFEDLKCRLDDMESDSDYIFEIVNKIVKDCCENLDKYVEYVKDRMSDANCELTNKELDDIIVTIPTLLYFVSVQQEKLGIKHDISKLNRNAVFNKEYLNAPGTAGAKKAQAESKVINDDIASIIFVRAYNTIKSKVDAATEILQSAKKVVSRRISEFELSKVSVDRNKAVF